MDSFLSLNFAQVGVLYEIDAAIDDCSFVMRRLGDLGFFPGGEIVLLKRSMFGCSILISLDGVKMMIRSDLAEKIILRRK